MLDPIFSCSGIKDFGNRDKAELQKLAGLIQISPSVFCFSLVRNEPKMFLSCCISFSVLTWNDSQVSTLFWGQLISINGLKTIVNGK